MCFLRSRAFLYGYFFQLIACGIVDVDNSAFIFFQLFVASLSAKGRGLLAYTLGFARRPQQAMSLS